MLSSGSQWRHKRFSDRETFHSEASKYLEEQFDELSRTLSGLQLDRTAHINALVQSAEAELEKVKYEAEMRRIQEQQKIDKEKLALEEEHRRRLASIAEAQEKAAKEHQKSLEAAKKVAEEEARIAQEKAAAEKRDEEQRKKDAEKKAAAEKSEREAAAAKARAAEQAAASAKAAEAKEAAAKREAALQTQGSASQPSFAGQPRFAGQTNTSTDKLSGSSSREQIDAEHASYMNRIQWIKTNVKEAMRSESADLRKQTMDIKLKMRPQFGMLTNSVSQLMNCRLAIKSVLETTRGNALVYHWVLNTYAKMLVEQSESEANVQPQNALPLAMLTMLLWSEFPELGDFVIPRIVKRCPQVIGYYCAIDTDAGRKRMGWRHDDDTGKYETLEKYMGRLSGICAVWACMTQTKIGAKNAAGEDHPYPLSHSWKFLARHLNKPSQDVGPTDFSLVAAWWDMTAMRLHEAFGKQGTKILDLVWDAWTRGKNDPPAMRLRGLGENWKSTGKIEAAWKPLHP